MQCVTDESLHLKASSFPSRSSHQRCSIKKLFLKVLQYSQENICAGISFLIKLQASFIEKETPTQVFSCACFKKTYFEEQLLLSFSVVEMWKQTMTFAIKQRSSFLLFVLLYILSNQIIPESNALLPI